MEYDAVKLANSARIPCTMRTLKPFNVEEGLVPWVHSGEAAQALLYLATRIEFEKTPALKELLEELSSSLKVLQEDLAPRPVDAEPISEQ